MHQCTFPATVLLALGSDLSLPLFLLRSHNRAEGDGAEGTLGKEGSDDRSGDGELGARGSSNLNRQPRPGRECTVTLPP